MIDYNNGDISCLIKSNSDEFKEMVERISKAIRFDHNKIVPMDIELNCDCGSKHMIEFEHYYDEDGRVEEYSTKCAICGKLLGHWAFGEWIEW